MTDFRDAISEGDKRAQYEAIRDRITEEMDPGFECCDCNKPRRSSGSETAALVLRLTKILEVLEAIPDTSEVSRYDELKERRESTGGDKTAGRRQGGRRRRGSGA